MLRYLFACLAVVLRTAPVHGQEAFGHMSEAQKRFYTPQALSSDSLFPSTPYPAGKPLRLVKGWVQTGKIPARTVLYVTQFDCRTSLRAITRLDSLVTAYPELHLALVSADDWSLLGGIQDLFREREIRRPFFTLDMVSYDANYNPKGRLRAALTELGERNKHQYTGLFLMQEAGQVKQFVTVEQLVQYVRAVDRHPLTTK